MFRRFLYGLPAFGLAFAILTISLLKSATVRYAFGAPNPTSKPSAETENFQIDYFLPYPGRILPGSPVWPLKALRDAFWYRLTRDPLKRAEIALLSSDKRIAASQKFFENKNFELGLTVLTKSEKYLETAFDDEEEARKRGTDTSSFLNKYALSSLKHRQVIDQILEVAPDEARPSIAKIQDYSKNAYKFSRDVLNSKGLPVPKSPFSGD